SGIGNQVTEQGVEERVLQSFNLATMSGIFPGTRTQVYQRAQVVRADDAMAARGWIQVHWYEEPRRCTVYLATPGTDATATEPLLQLTVPTLENFVPQLGSALQRVGWQLVTCGTCHFWQPAHANATAAHVTEGRCGWTAESQPIPLQLCSQSPLALRCPHWNPTTAREEQSFFPSVPAPAAGKPTTAPLRRSGESAAVRRTQWQRFTGFLRRTGRAIARTPDAHKRAAIDWESLLEERSGVGAGTEPCFVCQGRIANLGALTVATPEDDKQTFSLWRCRSCYTLYLNNWIDRWERLDNLETEESYYRIAPAEALRLLTLIYQEQGGEHPNRRHERTALRQQFLDFLVSRVPLSHQVRQGR
ncbi:MAG: hypothetical protein KDE19_17935, partial [Caldilineaceae bacterium]|nr:hypothetical protein [Caldilineaceae bacterium]